MDAFEHAVTLTLQHEGGYSNDPSDPGGETNYGISKRAYPKEDIKGMTVARAKEIYCRDYWMRGAHLIDDPSLATKFFDLCVNVGVYRASVLLQQACNLFLAGLKEDGKIGPLTARWINDFRHPKALLCALKGNAFNFYKAIGTSRYFAGWLNRLEA